MVGVLVEAEHQVPRRVDPIDPVVFMTDARRIPEANFQSCGLRIGGVTQKRRRINIRDNVARSSSRRTISYVITPRLVRQSVVNVAEESPLRIPVATGKKDHLL
jgi:hypothetical protein